MRSPTARLVHRTRRALLQTPLAAASRQFVRRYVRARLPLPEYHWSPSLENAQLRQAGVEGASNPVSDPGATDHEGVEAVCERCGGPFVATSRPVPERCLSCRPASDGLLGWMGARSEEVEG
jgi:hypothetical protein